MIPDRENTATLSGNLTGDKIAMQIEDSAMAHIMSILTDMYSDPEMAVIREYSTNAHDAHIEAGTKRPIEVTLPSAMSPFLKIKDFGVGLTVDDIHDIYSKYGASTKRGSNDQVGMLGLGCKSALTYASKFVLTSVKQGTKVVVEVSRDEEGAGHMIVADTRQADEHDGTEVTIPARNGHSLVEKAQRFFQYWKPGTVLLNGEAPKPLDGFKLTDDLYLLDRGGESKIVMGNVAYPADFEGLRYNSSLVAYVPIGSVNFPPSRESLMMTDKTKNTLKLVQRDMHAAAVGALQAAVDKADTAYEAVESLVRWTGIMPVNVGTGAQTYTWRGKPIPNYIKDIAEPGDNPNGYVLTSDARSNYYLGRSDYVQHISPALWPSTVFVYGYTPLKYNANHKRKMQMWVAEMSGLDTPVKQFAMLRNPVPPKTEFLDPKRIVSWETIRALKLEADPASTSSTPSYRKPHLSGSYRVLKGDGAYKGQTPADDLPSKHLFWTNGNRWESEYTHRSLRLFCPQATLVCLQANRITKFCRDFPNATKVSDALKRFGDTFEKSLSQGMKDAIALQRGADYGAVEALRALDPSRVDDPDLTAAIKLATVDTSDVLTKFRNLQRQPPAAKASQPLRKYPLYAGALHRGHKMNMEHVYLYLNAAYAAEQEAV